ATLVFVAPDGGSLEEPANQAAVEAARAPPPDSPPYRAHLHFRRRRTGPPGECAGTRRTDSCSRRVGRDVTV
ncbi:hypothetical protein O2W19_12055, partial [Modestobacter sp. VKM Ac-2980]|uniref:hypothetical protein n=1 Tax=Modestobacter sp. VKM Ac-2980 TaxID=3004134 RepID=UPI0022AB84EA